MEAIEKYLLELGFEKVFIDGEIFRYIASDKSKSYTSQYLSKFNSLEEFLNQ